MDDFVARDGSLFAEGVPLSRIADSVGTPAYVYSRGTLVGHFRRLRDAFAEVKPHIGYAVKANGNLALLKILSGEGARFDVVSRGEIFRVIRAGGDPARIDFEDPGKRRDEIEYALGCGIRLFNVESEAELDLIDEVARARGKVASVGLRVNPDVDPRTHAYITTGKKENKFGLDVARARRLAGAIAGKPGVRLCGLHVHIGSQITEVAPYVEMVGRLLDLARELRSAHSTLVSLNIGKVRPWASSEDLLGHVGGDFRHASPRLVEQVRTWNDLPENTSFNFRQIILTGPEPFFEKLEMKKDTLPMLQGEISPSMRTIIKTQADLVALSTSPFHIRPAALGRFGEGYGETKVERKQLDRAFHFAARQTEQALTWQEWHEGSTSTTRVSTLLAELYMPVLEFGHHDPFIGCCVIEDYDQQITLLRNSISRANGFSFKAYHAIASQVDTQNSGLPCIIFNSQSWERQEMVSLTLSFEPGAAFVLKASSNTGLRLASQMVDPIRHLDGSLASVNSARPRAR